MLGKGLGKVMDTLVGESVARQLQQMQQEAIRRGSKSLVGRISQVQRLAAKGDSLALNEGLRLLAKSRAWGAAFYQKACFVAGTPLLTPTGEKAIELLQPGDLVLSRSEHDSEGSVEAKPVVNTFVRVAPVLELRIGGRSITTTAEHPFYVVGRGWVAAGHLSAGDLLCSHDGSLRLLDHLIETGKVTTVYNVEVADFHTYFVGCQEWGFSVWAHNANGICFPANAIYEDVLGGYRIRYYENGRLKWLENYKFETVEQAEAWIAQAKGGGAGFGKARYLHDLPGTHVRYQKWVDEGLTDFMFDPRNAETFPLGFDQATTRSKSLVFDLRGVNVREATSANFPLAAATVAEQGKVTEWELRQILQSRALLDKTTFLLEDGTRVFGRDILKHTQPFMKEGKLDASAYSGFVKLVGSSK
jgi:hypothetical protein